MRLTVRVITSFVVALLVISAILFIPAGSLAWPEGWVYVVIITINFALNLAYLSRVNPELIEQRTRFGKGTKTWDKIWAALFGPLFVSIYVVSGLDAVRFRWSSPSFGWWPVGLVLLVLGTVLFTWSMGVNPFFEKTVRIQTERDHRVIDRGPYRFVRHPGYLGFFGWTLSAPLLLRSWWAFIPAALSLAGIVVRTALEDRTLHAELDGYCEYASRIRYRLVPGLW